MTRRALTEHDFVVLAGEVLGRTIDRVHIQSHVRRPYSEMWFLDAYASGTMFALVAKTWDSDVAFDRQVAALQQARATSTDADTCIPYLGSVKSARVLLMSRVADPTIADLCRISLHGPVRIPYLCDRRDQLQAACVKAGRWLRAWHVRTAVNGLLTTAFDAYLANRADCLMLVDQRTRSRIIELATGLQPGALCTPHGDFTPPNILWSSQHLTVLDFGVSEWRQMSPWWDCVSFEAGLHRALRFSPRGIGTWTPSVVDAAVTGFRRGYGELVTESPARQACLAIRHLVLYAGDIRRGHAYRRRALWHHHEMQRALEQSARTSSHRS
jgi:hypothetical protein